MGVVNLPLPRLGETMEEGRIVTWLKQTAGWNSALWLIGGLFLMGAVCWCLIDPHRRIFAD